MRIHRGNSRLNFRKTRRQRAGCFPMTVLIGLLIALVLTSRDWIEQQFNPLPPQTTSGDLRNAQGAFERGELNATISAASRVWESNPNQVEALALLVRALVYRSYTDYEHDIDRDIALQLTDDAENRLADNLDVLAIHAFALQANREPVQAAQIAEYVLERRPDHTLAHLVLGLAYGGAGGYDNALAINRRIIFDADDPLAMDVYRARAIHYHDLGRYQDAINAVDRAIEQNPRLLTLHFERALYARLLGDTDMATASYFRILAFDPTNVKVRLRMCEMSSLLREYDIALDYCRQVTDRAPRWAEGWYQLGREYYLRGDYALAQQSFNRCTSLQVMQGVPIEERQFECWYLQGQTAEILGDCDNLLHTYNEFQEMAATTDIPQTWVYPPEGPAVCVD